MFSYSELSELLRAEGVQLSVGHPIERHALEYTPPLSEGQAATLMAAALPEGVTSRLFEFQREGVSFALRSAPGAKAASAKPTSHRSTSTSRTRWRVPT